MILKNNDFDSVAALIHFHHEWSALRGSAESFRRNYPSSDIFIMRDTRKMINHHLYEDLNVKYLKSYSVNQWAFDSVLDRIPFKNLPIETLLKAFEEEICMFTEIITKSKAKYILYMQADSYIQRKFSYFQDFDLDTFTVNKYPTSILNEIISVTGKSLQVDGFGPVTHLMKTQTLERVIHYFKKNRSQMKKFISIEPAFTQLDYHLPILFHLVGGHIVNSGKVGECLRLWKFQYRKFDYLHQYRFEHEQEFSQVGRA